MRQNKYEYDAFISHAVEDKIPIANELCAKLERAGLKIWYSGKELGVGDSIEKTIERGLNRSRYGIVVFSPTYLAKNWTIREFYTLLAKEIEEQKVILPVLYNITLDELKNKDLVMADRFAVSSDKGLDFVVERLVREIRKAPVVRRKEAWFSKIWFVLILSLLANVTLLLKDTVFSTRTLPDESSRDTVRTPANNPRGSDLALFGEMQGLFTKMNACACNSLVKEESSQTETGFARTVSNNRQHSANAYTPHHGQVEKRRSPQGSKVTMALVFQIETPSPSPTQLDDDLDTLINAINLEEENDPFLQMTSLSMARDEPVDHCRHHTTMAD